MLKKYKIIKNIFLLVAFVTTLAHAQVLSQKFDSKDHPKAKGVWATVRYPYGFEVKEGERPNIVQKFSGEYKGLYTVLSLQILNAGAPIEAECKNTSAKEMTEAFSDSSADMLAQNLKKTTHENKPAFIYDARAIVARGGVSLTTYHRVMTVCHKNAMISMWCSPTRIDYGNKSANSLSSDLNEVAPLCFQFFNSLVLMDSY